MCFGPSVLASVNYSIDSSSQLGSFFDGSPVYDELESLNTSANNHAEVELNNTNNSSVKVIQYSYGFGTNKAKVIQDQSSNSAASVVQYGYDNLALVKQTNGTENIAELTQIGYDNTGYIEQNGSYNEASLIQCSHYFCNGSYGGSEISIIQNNDGNYARVVDTTNASYGIEQSGGDNITLINHMNRSIYVKQ